MKIDGVFVTGIGCIGDFGVGKREFKDFFDQKESVRKKVSDFKFNDYMNIAMLRRADENSCFASVAAKMAIDDAGLDLNEYVTGKIGMVMATTHGPLAYTLEYHQEMIVGNAHMVSPLLFSNSLPNTMASYVGNIFKICGSTITLTGYNSVLQAVKCGGELVAGGIVDVCLVGGVDVYDDVLKEAYHNCLKNPEKISESFGGSGVIVLETARSVKKRAAKPYVKLLKTEINTLNYSRMDSCKGIAANLASNAEADGVEQIITSCWDNEECHRGRDVLLADVKKTIPIVDCSDNFAFTFTAGEVFKVIFAILKVLCEKQNKILVQSVTKLGSCGSLLLGGYKCEA